MRDSPQLYPFPLALTKVKHTFFFLFADSNSCTVQIIIFSLQYDLQSLRIHLHNTATWDYEMFTISQQIFKSFDRLCLLLQAMSIVGQSHLLKKTFPFSPVISKQSPKQ